VSRDIDQSSEDVLSEWRDTSQEPEDDTGHESAEDASAWGTQAVAEDSPHASEPLAAADPESLLVVSESVDAEVEEIDVEIEAAEPEPVEPDAPLAEAAPMPIELSHEHAAGELDIPDGYAVLEGEADGGRRAVGVVVARFNGSVTSRLLTAALDELESAGVKRDAITILVVPGAFELPLAATALAKTRRFACIVALGCVIRGDTPHFDYVASEAASGLQLAALETGVPVSFGVLTLDRVEQAEARVHKGAEAVRSALEMADLFAHLRAAASR
jgi:6,7-dimethyl-8-ribityllumazine synthase